MDRFQAEEDRRVVDNVFWEFLSLGKLPFMPSPLMRFAESYPAIVSLILTLGTNHYTKCQKNLGGFPRTTREVVFSPQG